MQAENTAYWQEGIDSKALLVCFLRKLPYLLLTGVAGAVLGSGLYLLIAAATFSGDSYQYETEYYINFAEGRLEAKDYYNDFTWNDVMATDLILGNTMEILGTSFDRAAVREMITADILSDVRYLTITVTGGDKQAVEAIGDATRISLESFGERMEEFDSIEQIENNGVQKQEKTLFPWRAAALGALVGFLTGSFLLVSDFCIGSRFYTKRALSRSIGLPVLGLLYAEGNQRDGVQEKALQSALQYRMETLEKKQLLFIDCGRKSNAAEAWRQVITSMYTEEELGGAILSGNASAMGKEENVILTVPFAQACREQTIEIIGRLENQGCHVLGAVLTEVDRGWTKMYGIH